MPWSCPVGCGRNVQHTGQLLCPECWAEVPRELRNDVNTTWREYRRSQGKAMDIILARRRLYEAARDAAIASVK